MAESDARIEALQLARAAGKPWQIIDCSFRPAVVRLTLFQWSVARSLCETMNTKAGFERYAVRYQDGVGLSSGSLISRGSRFPECCVRLRTKSLHVTDEAIRPKRMDSIG
ncbi:MULTISPECIES: hypothetical protein [unclassified Methylobacterium]|uniref:hypothetical protein n=1 Tax=unclassified Methylobacterium TaxID=2615210 RepID=UPI0018DF21C9|nr:MULTISPECIES: hypothetical protein [Methylobacterium]WFT83427.1 hypothetical protein QA634_17015 [Methylobacterium nodulans]